MSEAVNKDFECSLLPEEMEKILQRIDEKHHELEKNGKFDVFDTRLLSEFDVLQVEHESEFLEYYLKALKRTWAVDINDFDIPRKSGILGYVEWQIKKVIWKVLKFYTYRLFSQQRAFNSQISRAMICLNDEVEQRFKLVEQKIRELESAT